MEATFHIRNGIMPFTFVNNLNCYKKLIIILDYYSHVLKERKDTNVFVHTLLHILQLNKQSFFFDDEDSGFDRRTIAVKLLAEYAAFAPTLQIDSYS